MAVNPNDKLDRDVSRDGVDRNPDPITGAPGSHPVGTGIGSASGAATGAAIGAIGGPVGAIIGGVAGAIVGGGVGHAAGEWNDPTEDEAYWRNSYTDRPYVKKGESYDTYADAYRYGGTAARTHYTSAGGSSTPSSTGTGATGILEDSKNAARALGAKVKDAVTPDSSTTSSTTSSRPTFESRESEMRADWEKTHGSKLGWDRARNAVKDAYDRTLQLREERLNVGKERVQTGEANIRKEVTTEHRTVDVPLQREELVIERRPASGGAAAGAIGDAETIRVPLSEDRATVNKNTVVTEEVSIGKKATTQTEHVGADVRKETLKVDENVRDNTKR